MLDHPPHVPSWCSGWQGCSFPPEDLHSARLPSETQACLYRPSCCPQMPQTQQWMPHHPRKGSSPRFPFHQHTAAGGRTSPCLSVPTPANPNPQDGCDGHQGDPPLRSNLRKFLHYTPASSLRQHWHLCGGPLPVAALASPLCHGWQTLGQARLCHQLALWVSLPVPPCRTLVWWVHSSVGAS